VRKLADEADRVGDQVAATAVLVCPRRRIESLEQPLPRADAGTGERVQQRRLAGVGVTGERHRRDGRRLARRAHHAAVSLQARQPPAQRSDPVARQPAVGLDLRLARAPGADPAPEPLEVGPEPAHPRQVVLELGELHLELSLGAVGVVGEDVEDHRGAVDHRHAELGLEVSLLARGQLIVAGDQVGVHAVQRPLQLGELAATQVSVRIGLRPHLDHLTGRRDAGGAQQLLELGERLAILLRARGDPDRKRPLPRPWIAYSGAVFHRFGV
jgi:hypothetical protein